MKTLIIALITVVVFSELSLVYAQKANENIIVEGKIVGFQSENRCANCGPVQGIAAPAEFLIFRVNDSGGVESIEKFILVQYSIYERGITDKELMSDKLKFQLRQRKAEDLSNCRGIFVDESSGEKISRPGRVQDYTLIGNMKKENLPDFDSLPCFFARVPPQNLETK